METNLDLQVTEDISCVPKVKLVSKPKPAVTIIIFLGGYPEHSSK